MAQRYFTVAYGLTGRQCALSFDGDEVLPQTHHGPINEGGHDQRIMHGASRRAGPASLAPALKVVAGDARRRLAERVTARLEPLDVVRGQDALPSDVETHHRYWNARLKDDACGFRVDVNIELGCGSDIATGK